MIPTIFRGATPLIGLNDLLSGMSRSAWPSSEAARWSPAFEIEDSEEALVLRAELPGMRPEDVEITVDRGILRISGEKKSSAEGTEAAGKRRWSERFYGNFTRTMRLPESVDTERADARFEHGVLELTLPKSERARPRRIEVVMSGEESGAS